MTRRCTIRATAVAAALLAVTSSGGPALRAQNRPPALVAPDSGHVALGLAIRRLNTVGVFLQTDAHPDDENNALIAWLTRGYGMRAGVLTLTRGNGGQNEIGPELFEDLAVVRTSELLAAHRLDGAEQFFGRAIDFGFSFSTDETFRKWGREEILGDVVRHLRTYRPDVVLAMPSSGEGGGQHHQATSLLTREAFRAAADPARFPEQIREGLRPWQAKKLYVGGGPPPGVMGAVGGPASGRAPRTPRVTAGSPASTAAVDADVFDPLLGRTFNEIGAEARSYHKCQGAGQIVPLPGPAAAYYDLADQVQPASPGTSTAPLFDGVDTSIAGLVQYMAGPVPDGLTLGLAAIAAEADAARTAFDTDSDRAAQTPILAGLAAVRALRTLLPSLVPAAGPRDEIDGRLRTKEQDFQDAALAASGLTLRALADDGLVVGGQGVRVTLFLANHAGADVTLAGTSLVGFDGQPPSCAPGVMALGRTYQCTGDVRVPADARLTAPYWKSLPDASRSAFEPDVPFGAPFRPTPFRAAFQLTIGGQDVTVEIPVKYRYQQDLFAGEKEMELNVVPAFSVKTTPTLAIVSPKPAAAETVRTIQVAVTNGHKSATDATVVVHAPAGWEITPPSARLTFAREDETRTARFAVRIPAGVPAGSHHLTATVTAPTTGARVFDRGYQVVDYPHIQRRHVINAADTTVKVMNVRIVPGLKVGYVVGVGDQVPAAIEQLGAKVTFLGADDLAWGDLSAYDVIVTGVRAYERREDLRAYNRRLLEFAERGGTVIVQYNKYEFNQAQYGPYPAKVGGGRVTDEQSPVVVLHPDHPVFSSPNVIDASSWAGWVQERGLYFLGDKAPEYVDLVRLEDPFPYNSGARLGALVECQVGKGRWLYVGLGLWRQVPAGTDGAYQLLANLLSLPRAAAVPPAAVR